MQIAKIKIFIMEPAGQGGIINRRNSKPKDPIKLANYMEILDIDDFRWDSTANTKT